jgi:negative regulator of sigma E activity
MSEQILEQVSAFLDGELAASETELLLKRLTRDARLRESFGRYALFGECLRGGAHARLSQGFAARVNRAIDGEPAVAQPQFARGRRAAWWRPLAGAAVAAGVAAVAVVALQQRAIGPAVRTTAAAQTVGTRQRAATAPDLSLVPAARFAQPAAVAANGGEALSYTVPALVADAPAVLPAARLTNYVFAHSKYSSVLGQNDVLNDLLSNADAENAGPADWPQDKRAAP